MKNQSYPPSIASVITELYNVASNLHIGIKHLGVKSMSSEMEYAVQLADEIRLKFIAQRDAVPVSNENNTVRVEYIAWEKFKPEHVMFDAYIKEKTDQCVRIVRNDEYEILVGEESIDTLLLDGVFEFYSPNEEDIKLCIAFMRCCKEIDEYRRELVAERYDAEVNVD